MGSNTGNGSKTGLAAGGLNHCAAVDVARGSYSHWSAPGEKKDAMDHALALLVNGSYVANAITDTLLIYKSVAIP